MLLHVAAENKRVGSLEQALVAAESLAWSMLQFLVQVEIVFAFAAVAALVTVKRALASVHTHVFDQLVGGLGQVATLVALVMVAKAVFSDVHLQLQLICFHCLADPTFVLHLVVSLQVALHCCRAVSGVDAEWAPGTEKREVTWLEVLCYWDKPLIQPISALPKQEKRRLVLPVWFLYYVWFICLHLDYACLFNGSRTRSFLGRHQRSVPLIVWLTFAGQVLQSRPGAVGD